jgi:AGZA family xanthine/uracil permease-like MFS transporter
LVGIESRLATPASPTRVARRREIIGGITTFLTMSYIVIVNPSILAGSGTGMPFAGVLSATVLVAFSMTLMMGLYARLPFAVAPGMGLNAFFAYTIVLGIVFLVISATPLREQIATAIPANLRLATAAGIGLLLTFIGLRNAGLIEPDAATMVRLGTIDYRAALLLFGLVTAVVLMRRRSPLAFLASIFGVTLLAWAFGYAKAPGQIVSLPDFSSVALKLDVLGALRLSLLPALISIVFTDLFDSLSTFIGVATAAGLTEPDGRPLMPSPPSPRGSPAHRLGRRTWKASPASGWADEQG